MNSPVCNLRVCSTGARRVQSRQAALLNIWMIRGKLCAQDVLQSWRCWKLHDELIQFEVVAVHSDHKKIFYLTLISIAFSSSSGSWNGTMGQRLQQTLVVYLFECLNEELTYGHGLLKNAVLLHIPPFCLTIIIFWKRKSKKKKQCVSCHTVEDFKCWNENKSNKEIRWNTIHIIICISLSCVHFRCHIKKSNQLSNHGLGTGPWSDSRSY